MTRSAITLVLGLAILSSAAHASAQAACTEGRVRTPQTQGRCCWPAQSWARDLGRCEGPPQCPAGLTAEGDDCIAPRGAVTPPVAPTAPPPRGGTEIIHPVQPSGVIPLGAIAPPAPTTPPEWPRAPGSGPDGLQNPRWVEESTDSSMVVGGITLISIGYVEQLVMALGMLTSDTQSYGFGFGRTYGSIYHYTVEDPSTSRTIASFDDYTCRNTIGGTLLIPVLGPLIAGITQASCTVPNYEYDSFTHTLTQGSDNHDGNAGWILGAIPGAIMALIGVILLPVGLNTRSRHLHTGEAGLSIDLGGARLAVASGVPGANLGGLGLRLEF